MNEKIKQLADQARVLADEFQEQWKAGPSNEEFFQEKFAQSIVQECAGLFHNVYVEIENENGHTAVIAADYIKKHFGVEE